MSPCRHSDDLGFPIGYPAYLTAICLTFPPGRSRLPLEVSMMRLGGRSIVTR